MENPFKSNDFLFWQKWLFYTSLLFAFGSVLIAFYGNLFEPYNRMVGEALWHSNTLPPEARLFQNYICGALCGTISCCYILLAYMAYYPFKEKQKWAINAIIIAFGMWVIIDSAVCIYFEVYPQVYIINTLSILVKALLIIFTWKSFSEPAFHI